MIEEISNPYYLLAFVVTPAIVVAIAYIGVWLHGRDLDKNRRAPGE